MIIHVYLVCPTKSYFRAHEVRAWATSLALIHLVSLASIMQAAFWGIDSSFLQVFLGKVRLL